MRKSLSTVQRLWIAIGILALLSPLGVLIPKWIGAGGAWGEWGTDEIRTITGYIPAGMKHLAERWKAPLPDYAMPGQDNGLIGQSLEYIFTGIVGIAFTAGVMYILTKLLIRKKGNDRSDMT
jgi:cobalt/nickel transport protein